jgi:hypothetical protein
MDLHHGVPIPRAVFEKLLEVNGQAARFFAGFSPNNFPIRRSRHHQINKRVAKARSSTRSVLDIASSRPAINSTAFAVALGTHTLGQPGLAPSKNSRTLRRTGHVPRCRCSRNSCKEARSCYKQARCRSRPCTVPIDVLAAVFARWCGWWERLRHAGSASPCRRRCLLLIEGLKPAMRFRHSHWK